ncbi:MAG: putative rRNA maturation factor [Actinomycetota bacterium]|jgi:probable rRNA maturation factor|nr:putative rRNA maturation factor [Actinomycetota bacterium]
MNVFVANEQDLAVDEVRLSILARHALASEQIDDGAELSILLVTPSHIRRLNARFAGDDYPTDVLAFPMMEEDEDTMVLGDVVMCPQVARNNARKLGHSLDRELETLCVHGILHLLGYDHQGVEDGNRMERRLEEVLASFDPQHA